MILLIVLSFSLELRDFSHFHRILLGLTLRRGDSTAASSGPAKLLSIAVVGLSGGFKWKLDKVFKDITPHDDSIRHFDETRMEDNSFIFIWTTTKRIFDAKAKLMAEDLSEELNGRLQKAIGFKPTIRNVFAIILAGADTFLKLLDDVQIESKVGFAYSLELLASSLHGMLTSSANRWFSLRFKEDILNRLKLLNLEQFHFLY